MKLPVKWGIQLGQLDVPANHFIVCVCACVCVTLGIIGILSDCFSFAVVFLVQ